MGESAFAFNNVRNVEFPEGVNEIGSMASWGTHGDRNKIIPAKYGSYACNWAEENNVMVDFYR